MALAISRFRVATLAAEYMERVREIRTVEGGFAGAAGESFGFGFGSGPCTYGVYGGREHPNPKRAGSEPLRRRMQRRGRKLVGTVFTNRGNTQTQNGREVNPRPYAKKIGGGLLPTAGNFVEIICRATAAAGVAMLLARLRAVAANLPATLPHPASAVRRMLLRRAFGRKSGTAGTG